MTIEVKLPELGDGIESGDVLEVLVQEGDTIEKEQGIVELETDKATVEVPCSHAGRIVKVHVNVGDTVPIGGSLITVEAAAPAETATPPEPPAPAASKPAAAAVEPTAVEPTPTKPLPSKPLPSTPLPSTPPPSTPLRTKPAASPGREATQPQGTAPAVAAKALDASPIATGANVAAGPAIRRFAREVGVDLTTIAGTGENGRNTRDDVLAVVLQTSKTVRTGKATSASQADTTTDDWGVVRIEKMAKIRRTIADRMVQSWSTAPRVTNFDDADVTELERMRQANKADYAEKGIKLTTMPFLIKACAMALRDHPEVNASVDMENGQVIYKEYYNIGIAVDTDRGLVVPPLRDADKLSIPAVARELGTLAEKVRTGDFGINDLRGGTFTISNLGAIGGTYSTPIINVPEVAILLVGRSRKMPVVINDEIQVRLMMPLSMSYDHRLVDGATAARFLNAVINYLEAPGRLLLAL
jgi:pyruvate dehydrogenase E2 component (dihydrolipoamide acetyltransferase)